MTSMYRRPNPAALAALALCAALTLAVTTSRSARAQGAPGSSPEAEQLFRDGKRLLKEGKLAEACLALEASEKAEPNIVTLLSLADCHEKSQRYASAWARFLAAESQTRTKADKQAAAFNRTARARAAALEQRLSYLTINVPDESRVSGLQVTRDGAPVEPGQWNRAVPVDGGPHVISGKAPGHESWSTTVQVTAEGDARAVEVPRFKELPALIAPPVAVSGLRTNAATGEDELGVSERGPAPSPFTPRRKLALGLGAGGVVIAGTAIGLGLWARSTRDEALELCPRTSCTAAEAEAAQDTNDRARRYALYANLGYGVAGAALIGATVLWLTSGPERSSDSGERQIAARPRNPSLSVSPLLGEANGFALTGGF
jgi:tetratricopeptide (TPR) repeat protein